MKQFFQWSHRSLERLSKQINEVQCAADQWTSPMLWAEIARWNATAIFSGTCKRKKYLPAHEHCTHIVEIGRFYLVPFTKVELFKRVSFVIQREMCSSRSDCCLCPIIAVTDHKGFQWDVYVIPVLVPLWQRGLIDVKVIHIEVHYWLAKCQWTEDNLVLASRERNGVLLIPSWRHIKASLHSLCLGIFHFGYELEIFAETTIWKDLPISFIF